MPNSSTAIDVDKVFNQQSMLRGDVTTMVSYKNTIVKSKHNCHNQDYNCYNPNHNGRSFENTTIVEIISNSRNILIL